MLAAKVNALALLHLALKTKVNATYEAIFCFAGQHLLDAEFFKKLDLTHPHLLPIQPKHVVDLRTKQVIERTRDHLFSTELPVQYNPETASNDLQVAKTFAEQICCGRQDLYNYLHQVCGYALTGDVHMKQVYILHGIRGNDGKTTMTTIISAVMGERFGYSVDSKTLEFISVNPSGPSEWKVPLKWARCVIFGEPGKKAKLNDSVLKTMSSNGDHTHARENYGKQQRFLSPSKWIGGTNVTPEIDVNDEAQVRRIVLIPMEGHFQQSKSNKAYVEGLKKNHLNSFFAWMVEGAFLYYSNGEHGVGDLMEQPACVMKYTKKCLAEHDCFDAFLEACYVGVDDSSQKPYEIEVTKVWENYESWFKQQTIYGDERLLTKALLRQRIERIAGPQHRKRVNKIPGPRFYSGIGTLKPITKKKAGITFLSPLDPMEAREEDLIIDESSSDEELDEETGAF